MLLALQGTGASVHTELGRGELDDLQPAPLEVVSRSIRRGGGCSRCVARGWVRFPVHAAHRPVPPTLANGGSEPYRRPAQQASAPCCAPIANGKGTRVGTRVLKRTREDKGFTRTPNQSPNRFAIAHLAGSAMANSVVTVECLLQEQFSVCGFGHPSEGGRSTWTAISTNSPFGSTGARSGRTDLRARRRQPRVNRGRQSGGQLQSSL